MRERAFVHRRWRKIAGPVQLRGLSVRRLACPEGKKSYSHTHYLKAAVVWGRPSCCLEKLTDKSQPYTAYLSAVLADPSKLRHSQWFRMLLFNQMLYTICINNKSTPNCFGVRE